jgi:outer membrane protein assembly factor BamB
MVNTADTAKRISNTRSLIAVLAVLVMVAVFGVAGADAAEHDWIGFHNGGLLTGEAAPIGAPPMRLRWTYRTDETEPIGVIGSAAIVGDTVYVADQKGTLHAIKLADGKRAWTYTAKDGFETSPLVRDGRIFLGDVGGTFHAVSASDGQPLWTFDAGSSIRASANATGHGIVFGTDGAEIFCMDATSGKPVWRAKAGDRVNSAPAVGEHVFVSGCDAQLRFLGLADGAEKAVVELPALCPGSPAIVENRLVLGTDHGLVVCYDLVTHQPLWTFEGIGNKAMVYSSPAVSQGIAVVGARDRRVWGIDLTSGEKKWSFATRGDVDSSPLISDGRVYIGSNDKKLYVLDLQTGEELWSFTAGRAISASPAIARGVLVVGDEGGSVYCLEPAR